MDDDQERAALAHGFALMAVGSTTKEEDSEAIAKAVAAAVDAIVAMPRLIRRIQQLEQRSYRGLWKMRTAYACGSLVTHSGSVWHSNEDDNTDKPGSSDRWTLAVKRGRDGKNAYAETDNA